MRRERPALEWGGRPRVGVEFAGGSAIERERIPERKGGSRAEM